MNQKSINGQMIYYGVRMWLVFVLHNPLFTYI
jgi:hypothetical protein